MKTARTYTLIYTALASLILTSCYTASTSDSAVTSTTGTGGSMARFAAQGNHLYAVTDDALKVFDITQPQNPQYIAGKDQRLNFGAETIFPMDTLLLIGSQTGMYIYNIARPDYPQQISHIQHITSCDPVVSTGKYAYVTLNSESIRCSRGSNELNIYDISDTHNPTLVHTLHGLIHPKGLAVHNNRLYICDNGLKIYDISNPERPRWISDLTHLPNLGTLKTYDVIALQSHILLTSEQGLYQFTSNDDKLELISSITLTPQ